MVVSRCFLPASPPILTGPIACVRERVEQSVSKSKSKVCGGPQLLPRLRIRARRGRRKLERRRAPPRVRPRRVKVHDHDPQHHPHRRVTARALGEGSASGRGIGYADQEAKRHAAQVTEILRIRARIESMMDEVVPPSLPVLHSKHHLFLSFAFN